MSTTCEYYVKVTDPQTGTKAFLQSLSKEFNADYETFWEKKTNPDIKLTFEPKNAENYFEVIMLYVKEEGTVNFIKYLLESYLNQIQCLYANLELALKGGDSK